MDCRRGLGEVEQCTDVDKSLIFKEENNKIITPNSVITLLLLQMMCVHLIVPADHLSYKEVAKQLAMVLIKP